MTSDSTPKSDYDAIRCTCGTHAIVYGTVPDPGCLAHGDRGVNAWSTCPICGKNVRRAVGHACAALNAYCATCRIAFPTGANPPYSVIHRINGEHLHPITRRPIYRPAGGEV